ncbi:MAG: response regulator [Candidatus Zixiibacteriota bacterium]
MSNDQRNNLKELHILLVEDDPDHAELAMHCLRGFDERMALFHVIDGVDALDFLHNRGKYTNAEEYPRPHFILLDLRIPLIDGLEVLAEIKNTETLKRIPVVILTTSEAENDARQAYDLYANSYIVKPGGYHELKRILTEVCTYWLKLNRRLW